MTTNISTLLLAIIILGGIIIRRIKQGHPLSRGQHLPDLKDRDPLLIDILRNSARRFTHETPLAGKRTPTIVVITILQPEGDSLEEAKAKADAQTKPKRDWRRVCRVSHRPPHPYH